MYFEKKKTDNISQHKNRKSHVAFFKGVFVPTRSFQSD